MDGKKDRQMNRWTDKHIGLNLNKFRAFFILANWTIQLGLKKRNRHRQMDEQRDGLTSTEMDRLL
jgi:hypothetical protein